MATQEERDENLSKAQIWFRDNVVENAEDLLNIGALANRILYDTISLRLPTPECAIAVYNMVFSAICEVVRNHEQTDDAYILNIANRLRIGYTSTDDEEDEKEGNFMVFIQHVTDVPISDEPLDEDETHTIVLCTQWNAANVKSQVEAINEIAALGKKKIGTIINTMLESQEFVIPMFCIIHAQILNYIRQMRLDSGAASYEVNVAGMYTVGIQINDAGEEEIYYIPSVSLKLYFKSDAVASRSED